MTSHENTDDTTQQLIANAIAVAEIFDSDCGEERTNTPSPAQKPQGQKRNADVALEIAISTDIFRSSDGREFADVYINGSRQTLRIKSADFRGYIYHRHKEITGSFPKKDDLNAAVDAACAKARYDAPEHEVHVRVGEHNGRIYVDLANKTFQAIEVDRDGWRLIENAPIRFIRPASMRPLPTPDIDGDIRHLWGLLNLQTDAQRVMYTGALLAALRARPPYPICVLHGEQGVSKSTSSKLGRQSIDPNGVPLRGLPASERDLCISARNAHVLAFDNVSTLRDWMPDALCRLATGAGFSTRGLYTDDDEVIFDLARPVILNGIEDFVTRPDLADRCFFITLSPIPQGRRRTERELWSEFEVHHPKILGALLNAMVVGLRRHPEIDLELPRMADAVKWIVACETAFWEEGTFLEAYETNRAEAIATAIDANPVATALINFLYNRPEWTGTHSELLKQLNLRGEGMGFSHWPGSGKALSNRLTRIKPLLRERGIEIVRLDRSGQNGDRIIRIYHKRETVE